ncbi:hypothetical protein [Streptosporangium sp. NPDC087985]|uniref:hypothetical protein n=1 Tax=Streptosporangium sp. NPDC087985 TaxID=3366196 RepID=UPI0038281F15
MELTSYDYCGPRFTRKALGRRTYTTTVELVIGSPKKRGDALERNPFSLDLQAGKDGRVGTLFLGSAAITRAPGGDRRYRILTYWRLAYSDGRLSGKLVDTHQSEGFNYNLFFGEGALAPCGPRLGTLPRVSGVAKGSTLKGSIRSGKADLVLRASTTDGLFSFILHFAGQRRSPRR